MAKRKGRIFGGLFRFATAALAALPPLAASAGPSAAPAPLAPSAIRFLVPSPPPTLPGARELDSVWSSIVDEYNSRARAGGPAPVQLVRRGEHFSCLKDLMALHLAGDAPEIAAVETSELPAVARARLAKPVPPELARSLGLRPGAVTPSLPFQRAIPVLVMDSESGELPKTWAELARLAGNLVSSTPGRAPLALPMQGPRGLWLFEALAASPLWTREPGGLKSNRSLEPAILAIQALQAPRAVPELALTDLSWDRALEEFAERKTPLLVTSLDALPWLARKATFKWKAGPLPSIAPARAPIAAGSDLIVTGDRPEVWRFVSYLYSKDVAGRWSGAGGYLPLRPDWKSSAAWRKSPEPYRQLVAGLKAVPAPRSTDADVVRAHTEWISALHLLFGEPKQAPETVFTKLDSTLGLR